MSAMRAAQALGGLCAVLVVGGWFLVSRFAPKPCPGGVTLEFHPPLNAPGKYRFKLGLGEEQPCEFELRLPFEGEPDKKGCRLTLALTTKTRGKLASISALTFAAHPDEFQLKVTRDKETLYDATLTPHYAPYETLRSEDKRFCGERARLEPTCVRGSSQCGPYPASCDGPEDCQEKAVCCATPEWGREYGVQFATECTSKSSCLARLAHIACHTDQDCPKDMRCAEESLASEYQSRLVGCLPK